MQTIRVEETPGEVFPAGRRSCILGGPQGLPVEKFAVGHSTLFPKGSIPEHAHVNEEVYVVLSGRGEMRVGDEVKKVSATTAIYIPSNVPHSLINDSEEELVVMWMYAPGGLVGHWEDERSGDQA
ncbi:cupin domain-containing protein [Rhodopirellula sp. P2]|uniref:cupin domain-containing protein n=1 Tax=Rhodopirellula sp. P2 TaxID=2127060 RepID=UPI002368F2AB|nr:cupin domain-containing protein [Rhodopirellula sp. P2]WDQ15929.1 cupin domain-containing protein [Rhodopirellula sp. P2]